MTLPCPRHVKQLQLYAWLLARNGYPPPTLIRIVYMTMTDLRTEETLAPTMVETRFIQGQVLSILHDILSDEPPPEKPIEQWECNYCSFTQFSKNKRKSPKS